jgi:hypothetical protein
MGRREFRGGLGEEMGLRRIFKKKMVRKKIGMISRFEMNASFLHLK